MATAGPHSAKRAGAETASRNYDDIARQLRRSLDPAAGVLEIVRAGTLAANSHNTQPWRFVVSDDRIILNPDYARRCPVVDPDDHHLFVSLGCAVENMFQAAAFLGRQANVQFISPDRIAVDLVPAQQVRSTLAEAINTRQCTRSEYDGRGLSPGELKALETSGSIDGVECRLIVDRAQIEMVLDFVLQANSAQLHNAKFMDELISWFRFNDGHALEHLDGIATKVSGNASWPAWFARHLIRFAMTEKSENDRYAMQIRSSAGIAIFAAATDDPRGWMAAGRAYERFALQATALGIQHAFVNQPVEVAAVRGQFAAALGLSGRRPDLVIRFGRGPLLPWSLRRPVDAVVERA